MRFVGVDPGLSGGLALLNYDGTRVKTWPMPVQIIRTSGRSRREVDLHALHKLAEDIIYSYDDDTIVTIEQVSSSPQMGVTSAFNFGAAFASVKAAFAFQAMTNEHVIRTEMALPAVWKRYMRVGGGQTTAEMKSISRGRATSLWPLSHSEFHLAKDDGRAEAALLAEYGRLLHAAKLGRTI